MRSKPRRKEDNEVESRRFCLTETLTPLLSLSLSPLFCHTHWSGRLVQVSSRRPKLEYPEKASQISMATDTNTITITNPSHSPSNSQGSSTNPPPLSLPPNRPLKEVPDPVGEEEADTAMDTGVSAQRDNRPYIHDGFQNFTAEEILKYQKYEADYASCLKAKYFSNKDIYGGEIFDLTLTIGDETIKASRWSPTRSYADPKQSFVDQGNMASSGPETYASVPNGNITLQKKSS